MNTIPFTAVEVSWENLKWELRSEDKDTAQNAREEKAAFEYVIGLYVHRTNSVPPVEMGFDSGLCDIGWVEWTSYDHINHSLTISLKFG